MGFGSGVGCVEKRRYLFSLFSLCRRLKFHRLQMTEGKFSSIFQPLYALRKHFLRYTNVRSRLIVETMGHKKHKRRRHNLTMDARKERTHTNTRSATRPRQRLLRSTKFIPWQNVPLFTVKFLVKHNNRNWNNGNSHSGRKCSLPKCYQQRTTNSRR